MRHRLYFVLLLAVPAISTAQDKFEGKVLERLERLEEQNRALASELRALRQELAASQARPAPSAGTGAAVATPPALEERLAVQERRTEEQDQSKVESDHRLPVRLSGMLLFNAFLNGRFNGGLNNPTMAGPEGLNVGGATLRQSVLGLKFQGPTIAGGGKVNGSIFMDFFAGSGQPLNQALRLRIATLDFAWKNTTFSVGQDKPIIAPREPNSLAQVGVSPLTGAGNLWLWQPQMRLEQRLLFRNETGLRAQVGVYQTSESSITLPAEYVSSLATARPGLEGRFEFWHRFGEERRIEIAPGFHFSSSHLRDQSVPSNIFSIDWLIQPASRLNFSGAFFSGKNVAVLGALRQGIAVTATDGFRAVESKGGWAQLSLRMTERLSLNIYGGQHHDRKSDLRAGGISRNQGYATNLMYRFGSNILASFEASQIRTTYVGSVTRLNPHYDLAFAYLF